MDTTVLALIVIVFVIASVVGSLKFSNWLDKRKEAEKLAKEAQKHQEFINAVSDYLIKTNFKIDKLVQFSDTIFAVDISNTKVFLVSVALNIEKFLRFDEIISFKVIEDGNVVSENKALGGALLFGVTGAIVGSSMKKNYDICTSFKLCLIINDIMHPNIEIELIPKNGALRNADFYKRAVGFANEVVSTLSVIKNKQG